ncbi:MAG: ATP-binding protein [Bacteroidetes bacterium]|nr:MAG: ATP-binding protein [Bacteroidota bacterium]
MNPAELNAQSLSKELQWFTYFAESRMKEYFEKEIVLYPAPPILPESSIYAKLIDQFEMQTEERLILILALIPHLKPSLLDFFFNKNTALDRPYTEFGGIRGKQHSGFLPTLETAAFLLEGTDLNKRFELLPLFDSTHFFSTQNILKIGLGQIDEPFFSATLSVSQEILSKLTTGQPYNPSYNQSFPAKKLDTPLDWSDLVVEDEVMEEIKDIQAWLKYGRNLLEDWGMRKTIKAGWRSLFYGPPGTGKTLTACLLGKSEGLEVYRIDLSMIVSKYIGETEKNLANVFQQAENKNWILFFDEADSLFGKRTQTSSSNDRYANQEVSYLLQRIEDFSGVIILASNLKANMDEAFSRRFQSMIHFPTPSVEQRLKLWQNAFSKKTSLEKKIDLKKIAQNYEVTGGSIINITRYCSLMAIKRNSTIILEEDLLHAIRKEFKKDGKIVT